MNKPGPPPLSPIASATLVPPGAQQLRSPVAAAAAAMDLSANAELPSVAAGELPAAPDPHTESQLQLGPAATVASISGLIAGMLERKESASDETHEAARWMRSELVLLVEQAASLKERRVQMEQRRADLLDMVLDHIVHLLPTHLLGGVRSSGGVASQHHTRLLQHSAVAQATSGSISPWSLQRTDEGASTARAHGGGYDHHHDSSDNPTGDAAATASYYHSSRSEAASVLCAALDARKALYRCRLSHERLEREQNLSARPMAQELLDRHLETRKRTVELQVLSQRESLLQQQSKSLLQEMRVELERRDNLLKRRSELKKAEAAAVAAASVTATATSASLGQATASALVEYNILELKERKESLQREWERLRSAAVHRQSPPSSWNVVSHAPTVVGSATGTPLRRTVDPTVLLLPYTSTPKGESDPRHASLRSTNAQQQQEWVLPEQYLVRTL